METANCCEHIKQNIECYNCDNITGPHWQTTCPRFLVIVNSPVYSGPEFANAAEGIGFEIVLATNQNRVDPESANTVSLVYKISARRQIEDKVPAASKKTLQRSQRLLYRESEQVTLTHNSEQVNLTHNSQLRVPENLWELAQHPKETPLRKIHG